MGISATVHTFAIQLADVDRGVYEELELRVARHPSETLEYMVTRILAYCLQYEEGIVFSEGGISATDEPAVQVRDLTGRTTAWIEVGAPDSERIHRGSKLAGRAAVYTHRDPVKVLAQYAGKKIHNAASIPLYSFDRAFIDEAARLVDRRNSASLSITEGVVYLDLNGTSLRTEIIEQPLG
ncbi:YaeQ family protein [Nocardia sp. NPDC003979]